jgi:hypothetical protein
MTTLDTLRTADPAIDELGEIASTPSAALDGSRDAIAAAALTVVRRALLDGVPVTRDAFESEASFQLAAPRPEAMRELDAVAQRLGVAALA